MRSLEYYLSPRGFIDFPLRPSGELNSSAFGRPPGSVGIYVTQHSNYGNGLILSRSRSVIWGYPRPHTARSRGKNALRRAIFMWLLRIFYFARLAPMTCLRPCHPKTVVSPFGGFFSCVFLSLFVLVLLFLACLFPSVAWLVWLCLVVAVPGCCVRRCVPFLGRLSGAVSLLVLVLLLLPSLSRVWLVAWCGFVLAGVLSLVSSGSFLCLCFASCLRWGFVPRLGQHYMRRTMRLCLRLTPNGANAPASC